MVSSGLFVDANLLVLFVVGNVDEDLISKHRRLREYTSDDYGVLVTALDPYDRILVTPNTLTEASNLLAQHGEPERTRLLEGLSILIEETEEIVVASIEASTDTEFERLGLTDSVLLQAATPETPVLTVDFPLYDAISQRNVDAVVNFRHLAAQP